MEKTLTLSGIRWPRIFSFLSGLGMAAASYLTIRHFFLANYPESIFEGSFCDISAFFNCDSSAYSEISQILGVPLGYFGLMLGFLISLGAVFPSKKFEQTNSFLSLFNVLGVAVLFAYSVAVLKSLCLFCTGYYIFSLIAFLLFWRFGFGPRTARFSFRLFRPSFKILTVFACFLVLGAAGMSLYHAARKDAQAAVAMRIVKQFYELPIVGDPSFISPYWTARSTERFEDAPIRIVEYVDFMCPDCLFLHHQLMRLKEEFPGKINIAFQFFPLEGKCNNVVDKDIHPGACELSYLAAFDPGLFPAVHDEIFANFNAARDPQWRKDLAVRYGIEGAFENPAVREMIRAIIETGREYEKTSDRYAHGIRSTPTMIINGRMVIGTLPDEQMKAIFQALIEEHEGGKAFIENWMPTDSIKKGP